ncbi:MAG TPA: hypothetical protein VFC25_18435 [Verrucomicrobiae bacterium]|nr:hypothetical protein [Verrucomicrobiae bacterium]
MPDVPSRAAFGVPAEMGLLTKPWAAIKLLVLYLEYWIVGLGEEWFHVSKGNLLFDLERYSAAAGAYSRALQESKSPLLQARLGWCYMRMNMPNSAVDLLTTVRSHSGRPEVGMTLLHALIQAGKLPEASVLHGDLMKTVPESSNEMRADLSELGALLKEAGASRS